MRRSPRPAGTQNPRAHTPPPPPPRGVSGPGPASFPPDPNPEFWSPAFACPATSKPDVPEVFSCQAQIYRAVLNLTLEQPPGEKFVYSGARMIGAKQARRQSTPPSRPFLSPGSPCPPPPTADLSMITMMYVVGKVARDNGHVTKNDLLPVRLRAAAVLAAGECATPPPTAIQTAPSLPHNSRPAPARSRRTRTHSCSATTRPTSASMCCRRLACPTRAFCRHATRQWRPPPAVAPQRLLRGSVRSRSALI